MTTAISLNGTNVVALRLLTPWRGAWIADVDLDPDLPVTPSGRVVLTIGTSSPMQGTVDPRAAGSFAGMTRLRIVGGGGGWDQAVTPQHWHNDAGVLDATVITATAAQVGEAATVVTPSRVGVDYVRAAGPASRVLSGLDWYVDATGVTVVGPRALVPVDPTAVETLSWDPLEQRAELSSDSVIVPGMLLVDPRFGAASIRDVEQTWTQEGARATAWCGPAAASRLTAALRRLIEETTGVTYLRHYRYRVIAQNVDGRLLVQPVRTTGATPPAVAIPVWPGMAGTAVTVTPGAEVIIGFIDGDPGQPYVHAFVSGDFVTSTPVAKATELIAWAANINGALNTLGAPVAPLSPTVAAANVRVE